MKVEFQMPFTEPLTNLPNTVKNETTLWHLSYLTAVIHVTIILNHLNKKTTL